MKITAYLSTIFVCYAHYLQIVFSSHMPEVTKVLLAVIIVKNSESEEKYLASFFLNFSRST